MLTKKEFTKLKYKKYAEQNQHQLNEKKEKTEKALDKHAIAPEFPMWLK